jgi:hypothetical protein
MKSLVPLCCAAVATTLALAGCAAEPSTSPAPSATVTTVTPAPDVRSASDALTELDAWLACSSAVQGNYALNNAGTQMAPYDASMVSADSAGGFIVKVDFQPPGGSTTDSVAGAQGICTVSGTVGEPVIKQIAFTDFG